MKDWSSTSAAPTDKDTLEALVGDSRLTGKERTAFEGMLRSLNTSQRLSTVQKDWMRDCYKKYELDSGMKIW